MWFLLKHSVALFILFVSVLCKGTHCVLGKKMQSYLNGDDWNANTKQLTVEIDKYHEKTGERKYLTRLEAVQQLFQAFINRSMGILYKIFKWFPISYSVVPVSIFKFEFLVK